MACGCAGSGRQKGKTSEQLAASARPAPRYEVTRADGTKATFDSLVDALRERNASRGTYRQIR